MTSSSFLGVFAFHSLFFLGPLFLFLPVVLDHVEKVVDGAVPLLASQIYRVLELNRGLFLTDVEEKRPLDKAD